MPLKETGLSFSEDWERSSPQEDDLSVSAHGLTGRDGWNEYIQKKTCRFRIGEAKGILATSTSLHSQEEKQSLSSAADLLQTSSAVLESFVASIPENRRGEFYQALWEFGNANHDVGASTKISRAAFERSKRELNASRGNRARHGKMLKRASRASLAPIKREAVEGAIAKRRNGRFSITRGDAKSLCSVANGIFRQKASSVGIELEDAEPLTPTETLNLLSGIKSKKKSGL
ncbi:MAG: hypothetical protein WBX25_22135 [Rhodomicrobium sp.]